MNKYLPEFIVEPKSRKDIRNYANEFRSIFDLNDTIYFPVVKILDFLPFPYEIVDEHELSPTVHADADIEMQYIRIKKSVYIGACRDNGRDRMTIVHEIGHLWLMCQNGIKFQRNFQRTPVKRYQDPEWQAQCFAGELLMPAHLIQNMTPYEIATSCGVSFIAAKYQYRQLHRELQHNDLLI